MKEESAFRAGRKKNQLISLALIGVLVFLTFYTLHSKMEGLDPGCLWSVFFKLDKKYLCFAVLSMAAFVLAEGSCLAVIGRALGYRIGLWDAAAYSAADLYFSAITPSASGGQPASAWLMAKNRIKVSDSTTVLVMNILLYTLSLILMGIWALAVKIRFFMDAGTMLHILFWIGMLLQALLAGLCLLCMFSTGLVRRSGNLILAGLHKIKLVKDKAGKQEKLEQYIARYQAGIELVRKKPGAMGAALLGNFVQRFAFFSIGYFVYRSFGLHQAGYLDLVAVQTLLAVAVNSLPIPGAIGISEGSFLLLFQSFYSAAALGPAMIFTRGINYYLCFVVCGIYTLIYYLCVSKKRRRTNEFDRVL